MPGEIYKEQQKQQTPIQATREAEQLAVNKEAFKQQQEQQQQQGEQVTAERSRQMTRQSERIAGLDNYSETDDSNPADPAMEFADEQQREWYDRKRSAVVESRLQEG